ncbi:MAG: thymidylate kinase [Candidatus ainarchaeum sp.]|nr:thymidylate kinase [Candidatus ainarchaeum sp.]
MKGKIVVITGTDGSGKETQTKLLLSYLEKLKQNVKMQSFPNYESLSSGPVKQYLGGELSDTANGVNAYQASVLYAVDRFCTMKKYEDFLNNSNAILLLDRYMESSLIHQTTKFESASEKQDFTAWLENFEYGLMEIPVPNYIIFLDMPPEKSIDLAHARQSLKSGEKKDIHERDNQHLISAYANGKAVALKKNWKIISCVEKNGKIKTREQIQAEIQEYILPLLLKN